MPSAAFYIVPAILALYGIRKYREHKWGRCTNNVKLLGKVAIVTGANSGIGYEIAKDLASRGALVIMACRNIDLAAKAICRMKEELDCSPVIVNVVPIELDLGSLKSIRTFAEEINATYPAIDLLINNAGVSYPDKLQKTTCDGFEIHYGINHLGHFLLTKLLLQKLEERKSSRIIVVSSSRFEQGKLFSENVKHDFYADSKLANVYFCKELAEKTEINVYAVCPGWTLTNLFRYHPQKWYIYIFILPIAFLFMRSAKQGAQTAIYCATQPELQKESGLLYRDCKIYKPKITLDASFGKQLWRVSEQMIEERNDKIETSNQSPYIF